jgi:arginyl-tRNA synthetase
VIFDWDEFMSFEGNSGPYIQYSYVRAKRVLEKTPSNSPLSRGRIEVISPLDKGGLRGVSFSSDEEINLIKLLLNYKSVLIETAEKCMPHILCKYAFDLTKAFGSFYNNVRILDEENE